MTVADGFEGIGRVKHLASTRDTDSLTIAGIRMRSFTFISSMVMSAAPVFEYLA